MRNREAARYARWAAIAAGVAALAVAGVYVERRLAGRARCASAPPRCQRRRAAVRPVLVLESGPEPHAVHRRASHLTQYKDQNRALLQDVWITIYGREGSRNDNIHTRECSYEPIAEWCMPGRGQIDVDGAKPRRKAPAAGPAKCSCR